MFSDAFHAALSLYAIGSFTLPCWQIAAEIFPLLLLVSCGRSSSLFLRENQCIIR
jgi:hypothetical protein